MRVAEAKNIGDLVQALEALRTERLKTRSSFEEIWWNNIALVAGDHYMRWEPILGMYVERPVEDHNIRMVLNHARMVARTELGKLMKSHPVTDVMPKSADAEDIAAARVGAYVLDAAEWKWSLRKVRKSAKWWMILCGTAAVYTGWNPDDDGDGKQQYMIDPATNEPVWNPARRQELERLYEEGGIDELTEEDEPLGDLEFRVYSPFQLLPDDTVLEFEDCADLITTDVVQVDKAKANWRPREELKPDENQPGVVESRMIRRLGQGIGEAMAQGAKDTVQVHSFWLKPGVYTDNPYLKDGIMVRWANKHIVLEENKPYPYDHGNLPFAFFEHVPNATAIWSDCVIQDIRGPNLELDKTVSQLLENRDYMVNPMWLIPQQVQIQGDIKSKPGGEVRYVHVRDVPPPSQIEGVPLPVQVENLAVALRDQILDLSGQGEVSRGQVPSGVRSGVQMQYLQDEDETKLGPTADNCGDATARMGSHILSLTSQFYHHERILRVYKRGGSYDVRKFKGADLKGNTDVVYIAGSAHAKSKAARQQNALTVAEMLPGSLKEKELKDILEIGIGEPDDVDLAMAQADRENELMIQGVLHKVEVEAKQMTTPAEAAPGMEQQEQQQPGPVAVPVKKWHNHEAHLERHTRFMMDEEFERLSVDHPDIVRLFDEHVAMHQQALQEIIQAQLEQAMALRGMPDGPPGAPGKAPPQATPGGSPAQGGGSGY